MSSQSYASKDMACIFDQVLHVNHTLMTITQAYLRRGGVHGVQTPSPQKNFQIFLKSEGKEVERKKEKNEKRWGWGLIPLNC